MPSEFFSRRNPRADWWNYRRPGDYFITVCTKNREHFFGKIENEQMILSDIGQLAFDHWVAIPEHSPSVRLHEFQVMPNHIHGIIELGNSISELSTSLRENHRADNQSLQLSKHVNRTNNLPSLSSIVGNYKSAVTRTANRIGLSFAWQGRFHDHIIRNRNEFDRISNYIRNNPRNWKDDRFY